MRVNAQVKGLIEEAAKGRGRPKYLGMNEAYFIPGSELGSFYLVLYNKKKGWADCCRGFRFSAREDGACTHIDDAYEERQRLLKSKKGRKKKSAADSVRRRVR